MRNYGCGKVMLEGRRVDSLGQLMPSQTEARYVDGLEVTLRNAQGNLEKRWGWKRLEVEV
jgi:hypothetical protein